MIWQGALKLFPPLTSSPLTRVSLCDSSFRLEILEFVKLLASWKDVVPRRYGDTIRIEDHDLIDH